MGMATFSWQPAGDRAILFRLAEQVGDEAADRVRRLLEGLDSLAMAGYQEAVPGYTTLLVHYNPLVLGPDRLVAAAGAVLAGGGGDATAAVAPRLVEIPVLYGGEAGPDLAVVARETGLAEEDVVARHSARCYRVYFLGFIPGFAYMGSLDRRLVLPRLATPRQAVPPGSVGIAGGQTGVYPTSSPGGWRLLGRTPRVMYDPQREPRSLLRPGDQVRFYPITVDQFEAFAANAGGGEA